LSVSQQLLAISLSGAQAPHKTLITHLARQLVNNSYSKLAYNSFDLLTIHCANSKLANNGFDLLTIHCARSWHLRSISSTLHQHIASNPQLNTC
jgi:hypothetical protein